MDKQQTVFVKVTVRVVQTVLCQGISHRIAVFLLSPLIPLLFGIAPAQGQEAETKSQSWTPKAMMEVKSVGNVQVSPDGVRVLYTVTEAVMTEDKSEYLTQIYMANADGSKSYQFTYGDKSSTSPQWSPDGGSIAFISERSGKNNLWLIRADGGEARQLTDVKTGVGSFKWSPDGTMIAFTMSDSLAKEKEKAEKGKDDAQVVDEDLKMDRLWVITAALDKDKMPEARQLTKGNLNVGGLRGADFDWAPDGKTIVFAHMPTPHVNDWPLADISIVDLKTGEIKPLARTGASENSPVYSPDGSSIAYLAGDDPSTWGFTADVCIVDVSGGKLRRLAQTFDRQPNLVGWSADSRKIYFTETRGTVTRLSALPISGGPPEDIDRGGHVMSGLNLDASRKQVGFTAQSAVNPSEAYISRLDRFAPLRVSRANSDIPELPLGRSEVIRWKSSDGLEIEGLLTYPAGYQAGKKYPLLLIIHGGPTGVFTQGFIASPSPYPIAAFADQGYSILRCNIRGSSGYGKEFRYANYGDWGGMDYRDLMAGVDYLIGTGLADPERLGVMGWSYGGYMTSWIITQTSRFKAASIGAPVTNLMSFTGTTDITGFIPDYFNGEFWDRFQAYRDHSAMFNIKGVSTPALILHGEKDVRVPISQGYELYNALKRQGVDVKMVVYPRAPHGLREPKQILDAADRNLDWFSRHIKTERTSATK
ncbi:MAG TPA: S9 family peptidase [archaeon]|nr:S9 family peptidase [archaeon]